MPKKREIEVYEFDELSPKAKEKAITTYRHAGYAWDQSDTDMLTEFFQDELRALGLPTEDIRWRISYSQGDGVAFYGEFDLEEYLLKHKLKSKYPALAKIADEVKMDIQKVGPHMYDHWNTMRVISDVLGTGLTDREQAELDDLEELINEEIQKVSKKLEAAGYAEIEYKEGDENIAEIFRANDYEFDVNGKVL